MTTGEWRAGKREPEREMDHQDTKALKEPIPKVRGADLSPQCQVTHFPATVIGSVR